MPLVGKERLKKMTERVAGDAGAAVRNRENDALAVAFWNADLAGAKGDLAAGPRGVERVAEQVDDHLPDFTFEA